MAGLYKAYPEYDSCESLPPSNKPAHWVGMQVRHALRSASSSGSAIKGTVSSEPADHLFPAYSASGQDVWTVDWIYNEPGIVLSAVGARCGKTFRAEGKWSVVANTGVFLLRPKMNRDFFWYVTNDESFWEKGGSAQPYVQVPSTLAKRIGVPPLPEQKQIAKFLDHETAKIDLLIAKQQALIALLKEKRQAVISHAVTKGLNPNAKMKDSGVEWLGQVPEGWEVKRLRYLGQCQNGLNIGAEAFGSGYPFVSYGDVYKSRILPETGSGLVQSSVSDRNAYSVLEGDVFFTRTSESIEEIGFSSTCLAVIQDATFAGFLIRFRPTAGELHQDFSKHYFGNSLLRAFFIKEMNLITRASLSQDLLKKLPVLLPPIHEQKEIGIYLDEKAELFSKLTDQAHEAIELMQERRTALISAAVTGKIDVRDWEPAPVIKDEL